jgi:outer membrane protein assembly factor BamB
MYRLSHNSQFKMNRGKGEMKKTTIYSIFAFMTLLLFAPIGFALYPSSTPWSMYRYDVNHSGTTPSDAPTNNNTLWAWGTSAAGSINMKSTPIVVDGRVIFNVFGNAYALDETNGIQLWKHQTNGWLTAPSYADGRIFFGLSNNAGGVICLNASTGEEIWKQDASPYFVMGNPLVHNGIVYVGVTDNNTRAFNATTGHYEWGYKTDGPVYSSPAADGNILFFGSDDAKLYALDISGVAPVSVWNFTANGAIQSTPAIEGGKVFFGSDNHTLYALDEMTGELIWSWATTSVNVKLRNGVAIANNIVYVTSEDVTKIYALHADAAPGNYTETDFDIRYWTKEVSDYGVGGFNEPVYASGKIIVTSTGGAPAKLYALDADVGNILWENIKNWWPSLGNVVVADGRAWFNAFWWDPMSYTMYCIGDLFPPTTYLYTVGAGGSSFDVALETNSTITTFNTANLETNRTIGFNVAGIGTIGMCNITLPDDMLSGPFNVTVDGEQPFYLAPTTSNGTHTSLYFTYNGTIPHTVEITGTNVIPEFPTIAILPMLIATLSITLVQLKRKRNK